MNCRHSPSRPLLIRINKMSLGELIHLSLLSLKVTLVTADNFLKYNINMLTSLIEFCKKIEQINIKCKDQPFSRSHAVWNE